MRFKSKWWMSSALFHQICKQLLACNASLWTCHCPHAIWNCVSFEVTQHDLLQSLLELLQTFVMESHVVVACHFHCYRIDKMPLNWQSLNNQMCDRTVFVATNVECVLFAILNTFRTEQTCVSKSNHHRTMNRIWCMKLIGWKSRLIMKL